VIAVVVIAVGVAGCGVVVGRIAMTPVMVMSRMVVVIRPVLLVDLDVDGLCAVLT
jgi:hypothetical protein